MQWLKPKSVIGVAGGYGSHVSQGTRRVIWGFAPVTSLKETYGGWIKGS